MPSLCHLSILNSVDAYTTVIKVLDNTILTGSKLHWKFPITETISSSWISFFGDLCNDTEKQYLIWSTSYSFYKTFSIILVSRFSSPPLTHFLSYNCLSLMIVYLGCTISAFRLASVDKYMEWKEFRSRLGDQI